MDSHSSFINNKRIQMLFMQADSLGQIASNTLKFQDIQAYWYIVERIYLFNFRSIFEDNAEKGDTLIKQFYDLLEKICTDQKYRTKPVLTQLLFIVKKLELLVMSEIQIRFQYFFRFSSKQIKGLENTDLFNENIFSTKKVLKNETDRED